jgi:hypothetical protein
MGNYRIFKNIKIAKKKPDFGYSAGFFFSK